MEMNREKAIVKNTLIYSIGNFGSKVLSYIMVLVYTYYISSDSLGYYDLILTTISMVTPFVMCSLDEGIYRWIIDDNKKDKRDIISTTIKMVMFTTMIAVLLFSLINFFFKIQYALIIIAFFSTSVIYQIFQNAVRGLSNSKLYASSGLFNSFVMLVVEIVGLIVFRMGIEALLLSKIIAAIATCIYIYIFQDEFHGFFCKKYNKYIAKEMLSYSLPLVPNTVSWWIVNFSDRYIILFFLGAGANGIYAISNKFPTVVTVVTGIVYFALQESVIKEYNSPDRDAFYSKVFRQYFRLLSSLVICGIPATKIVIMLFTSSEYKEAWLYTSFLFASTIFSALSSFFGIGYQISRETKRSVTSTVMAAIVNLVVNIVLISFIGLHAASFSTFISYFCLFIIRVVHSKKYFEININWLEFCCICLVIVLIAMAVYWGSLVVCFACVSVGIAILIILNKNIIKK